MNFPTTNKFGKVISKRLPLIFIAADLILRPRVESYFSTCNVKAIKPYGSLFFTQFRNLLSQLSTDFHQIRAIQT